MMTNANPHSQYLTEPSLVDAPEKSLDNDTDSPLYDSDSSDCKLGETDGNGPVSGEKTSQEIHFRSADEEIALNEKSLDKSIQLIESEIHQIDQIVRSWSDGRTLRFDPAHVQPKDDSIQNKRRTEIAAFQSKRTFEILRTINFASIVGLLVFSATQLVWNYLPLQLAFGALALSGILISILNYVLVWYGQAKTSPYWISCKISNQASSVLRDRVDRETA